jgi:prophage tail gpP-like protein
LYSTFEKDEVAVEIDGKAFRFWTEVELVELLDGHPSVTFTAPFDPDNADHRETFRPYTYKPVTVLLGGEPYMVGTMVVPTPVESAEGCAVSVSCYGAAAVIEDSTPRAAQFPLEFKNLTLRQIAEKLVEPFGLTVSIDSNLPSIPGAPGPDGAAFPKVTLAPEDRIQEFLVKLAKQRGLILTSSASGGVLFKKSASSVGVPVALLEGGKQPVVKVLPNYSPQDYFSEITCVAKTKRGKVGAPYTESNFFLQGSGVVRPNVIELDDTDPGDIVAATQARMGRMFGNAVSYDVDVATWFDQSGNVWKADTLVMLLAPRVMVYAPTLCLVRKVTLKQAEDKTKTASLNLVLPGAFSGEIPEALPWQE